MSADDRDPFYLAYLAERDRQRREAARIDAIMAKCEHWGHAAGEWKYSCCACSGVPGGCENCGVLVAEELGLDSDTA